MRDERLEWIEAAINLAGDHHFKAVDALDSITRELSLAHAVISGAESYAREGLTAALFAYRAEFPKEQQ